MITADLLRTFRTEGYAVLPRAVAGSTLTRLREEAEALLDRLVNEMSTRQRADPRVTWWRLPSGEPYVFKVKPVLGLMPAAGEVAGDPGLLAAVTELLGEPPVLMEDKITYKQRVDVAGDSANLRRLGEEVHKHSDAAYFHARGFRDPIVTLAVCLDDVAADSGPVRVWPGSHLQDFPYVPTRDHGPVVPDAWAPDEAGVALLAPAGSAMVWDARLVHASGPNTSGRPRRLLVFGYSRPTGMAG